MDPEALARTLFPMKARIITYTLAIVAGWVIAALLMRNWIEIKAYVRGLF